MISRRAVIAAMAVAATGCVGSVRVQSEDAMMWVGNAGKILCCGDSITVGYHSLLGGWRVGLSSALTASGITHAFAGPYSDAYGSHAGVSGSSASDQSSALQTMCETYDPNIVIVGWGVNDVGGVAAGGRGHSAATALADIEACLEWVIAGAPQARVFQTTLIVPQNNGIPSYYSRVPHFEQVNVGLPALCKSLGVTLIDYGAPPTSDGLHPSQTGYASMATDIAYHVSGSLASERAA